MTLFVGQHQCKVYLKSVFLFSDSLSLLTKVKFIEFINIIIIVSIIVFLCSFNRVIGLSS